MATIGKFNSIINPSVIQLLDKPKLHSSLIEQISEISNDLTLSNMIVKSILNRFIPDWKNAILIISVLNFIL